MTPIEAIKAAALRAPAGIIDRTVYVDRELSIDELVSGLPWTKRYVDVPLRKIVALGREDAFVAGGSWRDAVTLLRGHRWTEDVFDYFESPILDRDFPAPGAYSNLRLSAVGGVCRCSNGNHRLVAAMAWLLDKYGEDAKLHQACIWSSSLPDAITTMLRNLSASGANILMRRPTGMECLTQGFNGKPPRLYLTSSDAPGNVYTLHGDEVRAAPEPAARPWWSRWHPLRYTHEPAWTRSWPHWLVEECLDADWMAAQVTSQAV